jgi:DNA-binding LacI/PurR family transcriptional regulator
MIDTPAKPCLRLPGKAGGVRASVFATCHWSSTHPRFVSHDMAAMGVARPAYDRDLKNPTDVSLVGFDDIRLAPPTTWPLTTGQMSPAALDRLAFRALINPAEPVAPALHGSEFALVTKLVLSRSPALASGNNAEKLIPGGPMAGRK